jgi:exopolysaccharide biosynthesis polyprenyl glycosylphosphotransferase
LKRQTYKYLLAILDLTGIITSFIIALEVQGQWNRIFFFHEFPFIGSDITFLLCFSILVLFVFQYQNLYKINVFLTIADQIARLLFSVMLSVIGFTVIAFFLKNNAITESRLVLLYYSFFAVVLLSFNRTIIFRGLFSLLTKIKIFSEPALIVGSSKVARILAANISLDSRYALSLVGFVDNELEKDTIVFQNKKILGSIKEIQRLVPQYAIKEILVCTEDTTHDQLLKTLDICLQTKARVNIASPLYDIISEKIFTEKYGDVSVVNAGYSEENLTQNILKRMFDVIIASVGLILVLPFLLIIALLIRLDSPGPALYSQIRLGKNGKPFKFYKFRSMVLGSDSDMNRSDKTEKFIKSAEKNRTTGNNTKIVDSSKITRVGQIIRKTSLDELPQLINVIKGDMSLVGPRPCLPYEWEYYDEWHKRRLSVIPGCTGVWQVNGRSVVSFEDMVVLDLYYIQNRSLLLDLQLLLKTIPVMAFGKGGA